MSTSNRKQQHASRHSHGLPSLRRKLLPASLISLLGLFACGSEAWAGGHVAANTTPTGGSVVGGSGAIAQNGATTTVVQNSQLMALNWQTFNVGANASVIFKQPSFSSVALNRILDQNASQIFGHVSANGQIFLINTHGIIFGRNAQVNVGGLVASTLDLTPSDFLANHFNLDAHGGTAGVVNHGTIEAASGGSVSLIGGQVANDGLIIANYGHINLDGADRAVLDFDGDGLINVQVTGDLQKRLNTDEAAVANKGTLKADNGTVVLQASAAKELFTDLVNNSGVIQAGGISTQGGKVQLIASGGNAVTSGTIDVSGAEGGSVQVLSDQNVAVSGRIDASGTQGGGSIRVGGGYQGGEGLQTANATYVAPTATLSADATQSGQGGSVVVWGNQVNNFYGSISARGGALGGNGGWVETSSHYGLNAQGQVDASAAHGTPGTWLLDPYDVTIQTGGTSFTNPFTAAATSTIDPSGINSALKNNTNVFVFTNSSSNGSQNGDITVASPITATGTGSLYLEAAGSIFVNSNISSDGSHALNIHLWADYGGSAAGTSYSQHSCASSTACVVQLQNADITTTGGTFGIQTSGDVSLVNSTIRTGGASAAIGGAAVVNSLSIDSASSIDTTGGSQAGNLAVVTNGNINVLGTLAISGTTSLTANAGAIAVANAGNDFVGAVSLNNGGANNVSVNNGNNPLILDSVTVGTGSLTLSGNGISQASSSSSLSQSNGAGAVTLLGGAGAITLENNVDFEGTVGISNSGTGNDVNISNGSNLLTLGTVTVGGGLTVGASAIHLSGNVTSGAQQSYQNAVTLDADATLTNSGSDGVAFQSSVNGPHNLVISTPGPTSFSSSVGSTSALQSLTVGSGSISFGGTSGGFGVTTTGSQTYDGQVTQSHATTLKGSAVNLNAGVNGTTHSLTITGNASIAGTSTGLSSLSVSGTTQLSGAITSSGPQTYTGAVTLNGNSTLNSTGSTGDITFSSTVDGAYNLSVAASNSSVIDFNGAVGGTTPLASLTANGSSGVTLGGNVSTSGTQAYTGALSLGNSSTTLAGSTVTVNNAINQSSKDLAITGNAVLSSTGTQHLNSLTVSGTSTLDGNVSTGGAQSYTGAVTLGSSVTGLTGTSITFAQGASGGGSGGVTLTGNATFGAASSLTGLSVTGTTLLQGNITTTGSQAYGGAVSLGNNLTLTSSGSTISFGGTVDNATATQESLTANANGAVTFTGAVGGGSNGALSALNVHGGSFSANTLNIGSGGLVVNTSGTIGQSGGFTVAGISSFNAGGNAITLNNSSNDFVGAVSLSGSNVGLTNSVATQLAAGTATGNLSITSTGGDITQSGALNVTGTSTFNAGSNAIALTAANSFTNAVTLTGGSVSLTNNRATKLGATSAGSLVVDSTGAISQFGTTAVSVSGTSSFNAGSNAITLTNANALTGVVSLAGGNTTLNNTLATQLGASTITGTLGVTSTGAITQNGSLNVSGTSNFDAGISNITLTDPGNQFGNAVSLTGNVTQIGSNAALTLGTLQTGDLTASSGNALNLGSGNVGALTATANGAITQSGALIVTGAANLTQNSSGGDILLGNPGNAFASTIAFNPVGGGIGNLSFTNTAASASGLSLPTSISGNLTLDYSNALAQLSLPTTTIGGSLDLTAGGGIHVSGNETTGGGQAYHSAVTLDGDTVLTGAGPIVFGSNITGSFGLTINAGTGNITLTNAGNNLSGAISLNGANATLVNSAVTGTQLGSSTLTGSLGVTSTGAISQNGALTVGGTSSFNAGSQGITLTNPGNAFGGAVTLTGGVTQITNGSALTLGQLSTGNLTAISGGALNLGNGTVTGTLTATANGTINQFSQTNASKALTVSGAANLTENGTADVLLANPGNNFANVAVIGTSIRNISLTNAASGAVALALPSSISGDLTLNYANATLNLPGTTIGGALNISAATVDIGGSETTGGGQTYAGTVKLTNDATLHSTGNGTISLASGITGAHVLTLNTGGNVVLGTGVSLNGLASTSNTFTAGTLNINNGGNLSVTTTGGAILQSGAFVVTGSSSFNAGGNAITLTHSGNSFAGAVALTGGTTQISQGSALTLGAVHTGSLTATSHGDLNLGSGSVAGDLTATSNGGAIGETGALSVSGISNINAGNGAITLTNGGNAFGGAVNLTGGATQIADGSALNLGTLSTGDLTAISIGTLNLGSGSIAGNLSATSNGGAIGQTGALTVAGTTALNGGNGAVSLTDNGNVFSGAVTATGAGVSLNDSGDLTVASLTDNANGSVNLNAGGTLTAYGISAGSGDISLASNGGTLSTGGAISGGNISLTGLNGISSSNTITASGTLTMNSSQGGITSTGGITAGVLTGSSGGAAAFHGSNAIGTLGTFSANGFSLSNGQSLTVNGPVNGNTGVALNVTSGDLTLNGAVSGTSTSLSAAGTINEGSSGSVIASTLTGSAGGAATLSGANQVGTLGNFNAANFSLIDGQALTVSGAINGGASASLTTNGGGITINGSINGTNTALHSAGDIGGTGSITAGTLSGSAAGAAVLTGSNQVGALGNFSANGFTFKDGQSLTINGSVNGNSNTSLTSTGDIAINGALAGSTVTLSSAGAISEGGSGISANTLTGSSVGATTLNASNRIGTLGSFTANGFSLTNAQTLTVNGPVNGAGSLVLTTTSGSIALDSAVSGSATSLNAAGTLTEGSGGAITAHTLSGNVGGLTTLTGVNKVDVLGGFQSLAGFSFANDKSLTLSSVNGSSYVVNAGTSPVSISVTHGDLYQNDHTWTYDGTGSWSSTGAIGTQADPIYVLGTTTQYVPLVGDPPAYFYAVDRSGAILPIVGDSVNIPTSLFSSRAQNANNHLDSYIDASVITANYRSFGIVPTGILLPQDQQSCQANGGTDCSDE